MDGVNGLIVIVNVDGVLKSEDVLSRPHPLVVVLHAHVKKIFVHAMLVHAVKIADYLIGIHGSLALHHVVVVLKLVVDMSISQLKFALNSNV
jgi:hypothetical protein